MTSITIKNTNNGTLVANTTRQTIDLPDQTPTVTEIDLQGSEIVNTSRRGDDLIIELSNGKQIVLKDYFIELAGDEKHRLLVGDGSGLVEVTTADASAVTTAAPGTGEIATSSIIGTPLLGTIAGVLGLGGVAGVGGGDAEPAPVPAPTITATTASAISGKGELGATVFIDLDGDGETDRTALVDENGNWEVPGEFEHGDEFTVTQTLENGRESLPETTTVDLENPLPPTIDPTQGEVISGMGEPGATVTVYVEGIEEPFTAVVGVEGRWSVETGQEFPDGTDITAKQTDAGGNESEDTLAETDREPPAAPEIDPTNGDLIEGSAEPFATVTLAIPGMEPVTVEADETGRWSYTPDEVLEDDVVVSATQTDTAGNTGAADEETVDREIPGAPEVDPTNGLEITGMGEPNATISITYEGLEEPLTVVVNGEGSWSITSLVQIPHGTVLVATQTDPAGNTSEIENETVDAQAPAVPGFTSSATLAKGDGGDEPGATITVFAPDGETVVGTAIVDGEGNWETALDPTFTDGDELTATATDAVGNESDPADATVDDEAPAAPVFVASSTTATGDGTAEPFSTVRLFNEDGTVLLGTAEVDEDGNWQIEIDPPLANGTEITATLADGVGNVSGPGEATVDGVSPVVTIDPLVTGLETVLTGTGEANGVIELTIPGVEEPIEVPVNAEGNWTYTPSEPFEEGTEISVRQTDAAGNVGSAEQTLQLDLDADDVANTVDIDDDGDGILDVNEPAASGQNFDFEDEATISEGGVIFANGLRGTELAGWTVEAGNLDIRTIDESRVIELIGFQPATISQVIETVPGTTYTLSFDYNRAGTSGENSFAAEVFDSQSSDELASEEFSSSDAQFTTGSITFTATGETTEIQFRQVTNTGNAGNHLDNIRIGDVDGDGTPDSLDIDSDNGGVSDNVEAQFGQDYVAPSDEDEDGDGLDDAYDENLEGAENSVGLTPVDIDDNGTPDVYEFGPDAGELPLTIDEALTSGLSGTGIPGASIEISGAGGVIDTVTVDEDGTWSLDLDPQVAEDETLTATQSYDGAPDATGVATAEAVLDTDGDGVIDTVDIDDDGDGILDVNEQEQEPFDFTNLTAGHSLRFDTTDTELSGELVDNQVTDEIVSGAPIQFGTFFADNGSIPTDNSNNTPNGFEGWFRIEQPAAEATLQDAIDAGAYVDLTFTTADNPERALGLSGFSAPDGGFSGQIGLFVNGELVSDGTSNTTTLDPENAQLLNGAENTVRVVFYNDTPDIRFFLDHFDLTIASSEIGDFFDVDSDDDDIVDRLDTDSDNGGVSDTIEAQYGQDQIVASGIDSDGDGLDDAFDQNLEGAEDSVGLTPVDIDDNGTPDAFEFDPDAGELPLTIGEALTSGLSGTGIPGATITISVEGTADPLGTALVAADGTWSFDIDEADPLTVGEGDELTATQTHPDFEGAEGVATADAVLDTDFDGVIDSIDIDDDNDGILDVNDGDWVPVNFTGIIAVQTEQSFGSIDVGGTPVDITGELLRVGHTTKVGDSNGNLGLGRADQSNGVDIAQGDSFDLNFSDSVRVRITDETGAGNFNSNAHGADGDFVRVEAEGGFTVFDPLNQLTVISNDGNVLIYTPAPTDASNEDQGHAFEIFTNQAVEKLNVQVDGDTLGPIQVSILGDADTDDDGTINRLDTDSDNGGISDTIEAQFGQDQIVASGDDEDGDGLDDAFDETPETGPDGSIGLVPVDTDGDGMPDFIQGEPGEDTQPVPVITEALTSGVEGTGIPGATITISGPDGQIGDPIIVDEDGTWSSPNFDPALEEDDEITVSQSLEDTAGDPGVATAPADLDTDGDRVGDSVDIDDDDDGILDVNEIGELADAPVDFSALTFDQDNIGNTFSQDTNGNPIVGVTLTSSSDGGFQGVSDGGFLGFFGNGNGTRTVTSQFDFDQATDFRIAADTNNDSDVSDGTASNSSNVRDLVRFTVINPSDDFDWNFSDENFIAPEGASSPSTYSISEDGLTLTLDLGNPGSASTFMGYDFIVLGEAEGIIHAFTERGTGANSNGFSLWMPELDSDGDGVINSLDTDSDDAENDGLSDTFEAQHGVETPRVALFDEDGNPIDADDDGLNDGFDDDVEDPSVEASVGLVPVDADDNGTADFVEADNRSDLDTDDDGVYDHIDIDIDGDGLLNAYEDSFVASPLDSLDEVTLVSGFDLSDPIFIGRQDSLQPVTGQQMLLSNTTRDGGGAPAAGVLDIAIDTSRVAAGVETTFSIDVGHHGFTTLADYSVDLVVDGVSVGSLNGDEPGDFQYESHTLTTTLTAEQLSGDVAIRIDVPHYTTAEAIALGLSPQRNDVYFDNVRYGALQSDDNDNNGIPNSLQADSDGGGIGDNIEAQYQYADYIAPFGIDADRDGLDDAYDQNLEGAENSVGLIADDLDNNGTLDFAETQNGTDVLPITIDPLSDRTEVTGTGVVGATITVFNDPDGVFGTGDETEIGTAVVGEDGTWSITPEDPIAEGTTLTAEQSDAEHLPGATSTATETLELDTDGDGVINSVDIDDDNDGILDVDESAPIVIEDFDNPDISSNTRGYDAFALNFGTSQVENFAGTAGFFTAGGTGYLAPLDDGDTDNAVNGYSGFHGGGQYSPEAIKIALEPNELVEVGKSYTFELEAHQINVDTRLIDPGYIEVFGVQAGTVPTTNVARNNLINNAANVDLLGTTDLVDNTTEWETYQISFDATSTYDQLIVVVSTPNELAGGAPSSSEDAFLAIDNLRYAAVVDADEDGIIDSLDTDSDDGGAADYIEAQHGQTFIDVPRDEDGKIINFVDADGDGLHDAYDADDGDTSTTASVGLGQTDADNNGITDALETENESDIDTDGDGVYNHVDIDDDDDGILDYTEVEIDTLAAVSGVYLDSDVGERVEFGDGDIANVMSLNGGLFSDVATGSAFNGSFNMRESGGSLGTSQPHVISFDLPVSDVRLYFGGLTGNSVNNNNPGVRIGAFEVTYSDGSVESLSFTRESGNLAGNSNFVTGAGFQNSQQRSGELSFDTDPDKLIASISYRVLQAGPSGNGYSLQPRIPEIDLTLDADDDGMVDYRDTDSDDGGASDNIEAQHGQEFVAPSGVDENGDGLDDAYDASAETGPQNLIGLAPQDADNNGEFDFRETANESDIDTDGDGVYNHIDLDDDNDGILDEDESGTLGQVDVNWTSGSGGVALGNLEIVGTNDVVGQIQVTTGTDINGSRLFIRDYDGSEGTNDVDRIDEIDQRGVSVATNADGVVTTFAPSVQILNPILIIDTLDSVTYDFSASTLSSIEVVDVDGSGVEIDGSVVTFDPEVENGSSIAIKLNGVFGPNNPIQFLGTSSDDVVNSGDGNNAATQVIQITGVSVVDGGDDSIDADNDGTLNRLDTDSDGDGIDDIVEAQIQRDLLGANVIVDSDFDDIGSGTPANYATSEWTQVGAQNQTNDGGVLALGSGGSDVSIEGGRQSFQTVEGQSYILEFSAGSHNGAQTVFTVSNAGGTVIQAEAAATSAANVFTSETETGQPIVFEGDGTAFTIQYNNDGSGYFSSLDYVSVREFESDSILSPSGIDANGNGLDDAFESDPGATNLKADGVGLDARDTDQDSTPDFIDAAFTLTADNIGDLGGAITDDGQHSEVVFDGTGLLLDLTGLDNTVFTNVETVDLGGTGNSLTLDINDLLDLSPNSDRLLVNGDADDTVTADNLDTGTFANDGTEDVNGVTYDVYTVGTASLLIEENVNVTLI